VREREGEGADSLPAGTKSSCRDHHHHGGDGGEGGGNERERDSGVLLPRLATRILV